MFNFKNSVLTLPLMLLLLLGAGSKAFCADNTSNQEIERLAFLQGTWNYVAKHETTEKKQKPELETGQFIARFGPGKNSLIIELHGKSDKGDDVIMDLIGWNPETKSYETVTTGSSFPTFMHGKAYWNKDLWTMEITSKKNDKTNHARIIYKRINDNEMELEEWFQRGEQPYKLSMKMKVSKT